MIRMNIELLEDASSLDLLSNTLDVPLQKVTKDVIKSKV